MSIYKLLPIMTISKKKIKDNKVNYEDYLVELINNSSSFLHATNSNSFVLIKDQAHGECDAKSNNYEIDFKLLVPTEFMYYGNLSLPNVNYKHMDEGFIFVNDTEYSSDGTMQIEVFEAFEKYITDIYLASKNKLLEMQYSNNIR